MTPAHDRTGSPSTPNRGQAIDPRHYLALLAGPAWLFGIWLGDTLAIPFTPALAFGLIAAAAVALLWRRPESALLLAVVAAVSLGAARYGGALPPADPTHLRGYNGARDVTIVGLVAFEPDPSDTSTRLTVQAAQITVDGATRPVEGVVEARVPLFPVYQYGDEIVLHGELESSGFEDRTSYSRYLARRGIYSVMAFPEVTLRGSGGGSPLMRGLLAIKDRARDAIQTSIPEPEAALLTGILLGDDSGMTRAMSDAFRVTGMTHIIAISGFNIALLIALLDATLAPLLPRKLGAVAIMVFLGLYAVLVGAAASVVRAVVMGAAALIGLRLLGRPTLAVAPLLIAAFVMTLAQPMVLWDIGFQLSFAATLGLVLYAGGWSRRTQRALDARLGRAAKPVGRVVVDSLVVTLAAQLLTLPLIIYHFGRLALASLPANLLVIPVQPSLMATGGLATLAGMILPVAGKALGAVAWVFLAYTESVIQYLARWPSASLKVGISAGGLILFYALVALVTLLARRKTDEQQESAGADGAAWRRARPFVAVGCVALALLSWQWWSAAPDGRLHVVFLDVGQGDAILIVTPDGRQVLVDGGHYPNRLLEQLGEQLPVWDRSLDMVIATHPDSDHVSGLVGALERFEVGQLVTNGQPAETDPAYRALLAAAAEEEVPVHAVRAGEVIRFDDGVALEVLNSAAEGADKDETNEASIVMRLRYGELTALLTADAGEPVEQALVAGGHDLTGLVLKAGHHGSKTSTTEPFLRAVAPRYVVISVGAENKFGHPHPDVLARIAAAGATILRTDELGAIELISDGRRLWWDE